MSKFTFEQLRARAFRRIAEVLYGHWEEGTGAHTRLFEILVPDQYIYCGRSVKGGTYREYVVSLALIRNQCNLMFSDGRSIDEAADFISKHLKLAWLTSEEADNLNFKHGLKTTMPAGWEIEASVYARLEAAGIELHPASQEHGKNAL